MSKGLEALNIVVENKGLNGIKECVEIIEKELKRLEELEKRDLILTNFRTTSIINKKSLSTLFNGLSQEERYKYIEHIYYTYSELKENFEFLEIAYQKVVTDSRAKDNKIKALEIIKKKQVDIHNLLNSKTCEQYNGFTHWLGYKGGLTKKEFDLLKEVLL